MDLEKKKLLNIILHYTRRNKDIRNRNFYSYVAYLKLASMSKPYESQFSVPCTVKKASILPVTIHFVEATSDKTIAFEFFHHRSTSVSEYQ